MKTEYTMICTKCGLRHLYNPAENAPCANPRCGDRALAREKMYTQSEVEALVAEATQAERQRCVQACLMYGFAGLLQRDYERAYITNEMADIIKMGN